MESVQSFRDSKADTVPSSRLVGLFPMALKDLNCPNRCHSEMGTSILWSMPSKNSAETQQNSF